MIANGEYQLGCWLGEGTMPSDITNQPTEEACRSLAPSAHLLHYSASDSMRSPPKSQTQEAPGKASERQLGFSFEERTESSDSQGAETTTEGKLGIRTKTGMDLLENEGDAISKDFILKPSELVRLLNSTGLGEVISERQLYRHRQKAPDIHVGAKQINLIAYCAWLHAHRHRSKSQARRRRVGNLEVITIGELRGILKTQGYRCALTNEKLTHNNFALDHIVPLSEGGDFSESNCQIVTVDVNRAKHTMSQDAFIEMCVRVAQRRSNSNP
jgi:5-methylcytosine-specific restriction endonuclease McrA